MSRATGYLGILALLSVIWALPAACAQDQCANGPAGALVRRSTFAHGYLHGYEAGFHLGNLDFQFNEPHAPRHMLQIDKPVSYRSSFGPHKSFNAGFRRGFVVGYEDSISGRDFRAFKILSGSGLGNGRRPADFDEGFQDGYKAGDAAGAGDLDDDADFDPSKAACPAKADRAGHLPPSSQAYCAGYLNAYRVGYTDGFVLTSPSGGSAVVAAR